MVMLSTIIASNVLTLVGEDREEFDDGTNVLLETENEVSESIQEYYGKDGTILVGAGDEQFVVNAATGEVLSGTINDYPHIVRFDLEEWFNYWNKDELPDLIYILDLGYDYIEFVNSNELYVGHDVAEQDFRDAIAEENFTINDFFIERIKDCP